MPRRNVDTEDDWERVLNAALRLQTIVEGAVLVGGSGSAVHVRHRFSYDDDHVVEDLRDRYDDVLASLEAVAGWKSARLNRPVQILGSLDGIDTGIRQLRRNRPLDTELVAAAGGFVRVPTLPEMLRIKSWLVVTRNATRDYVDTAALAARLDSAGNDGATQSLATLDTLYPQENGESVLRQLAKQLAEPLPYDFERGAFEELRGLAAPWDSWDFVEGSLREFAAGIEIGRAG
jgi:hypothetical protein